MPVSKKYYDALQQAYGDEGHLEKGAFTIGYDDFKTKLSDNGYANKIYTALNTAYGNNGALEKGAFTLNPTDFYNKVKPQQQSQEQINQLWNAGKQPDINGFKLQQPKVANSNLGVDTGMLPPDTQAMREQEKKTLKQAEINSAHQYFDNNKNLLKELSKTNNKLIAKDAEGKDIEGEYVPEQLEKTSIFQKKLAEIDKSFKDGHVTVTHFQNGKNIGKPVLARSAGLLESLGNSIVSSFEHTKDAIHLMGKSPKAKADYLDEQRNKLPDIPEGVPVGIGSMIGGAIGGIIKPAAEFALGTAFTSEVGGWGGVPAAAMDIIPTSTSEKTKEIYYDRMNALEEQYGKGNVPEEKRLDAIHKAISLAPLQAIPNEAMQLYLFGKGASAANQAAIQSFKKTITSAGGDIAKMAVLGGVSEIATQGIKEAQTGDGKFDENISEAAGNWALMEALFKTLPVVKSAFSKHTIANGKNVLATADPPVIQELSKESVAKGWLTQEQADKQVKDIEQFAEIKKQIPANVPENKAASIVGLIEKNKSLEEEKKFQNPIFHDDINAEIKNNEQKAKDILNSSNPLKHETDNLTGERGVNVGGRPEKTQAQISEIPTEKGNAGSNANNEPITAENKITSTTSTTETIQAPTEQPKEVIHSMRAGGNRVVHAGSEVITSIDDLKLQSRDKGEYGKGFYVSKTEINQPYYGKVKSYFDINPNAKILNEKTFDIEDWKREETKKSGHDYNDVLKDPEKYDYEDLLKVKSFEDAVNYDKKGINDYARKKRFDILEATKDEIVVLNKDAIKSSTPQKEVIPENKNIIEPINNNTDAISEQSTDASLLRQERPEMGLPQVGARNTEPEIIARQEEKIPPASNEEKVDIYAEHPPTVLTHRGLQEIATEFGGEDVTPRERETRLQQAKDAEIEIDKWKQDGTYGKNINDVIGRAKEGKIDEVEQMVLANHVATLREELRDIGKTKGIHSQEFKDKFDELSDVSDAARIMRSKAGGLLGSKAIGIPDDTLEGFLLQEKDLNKGAPLTDNQITTAVNEHSKIESATNEYKQKFEDLQAQYAKLLAERELKKTQAASKKDVKKSHEDFVKERGKIVEDIREKLKKARQETTITIVPYANELIAIAPDVAKLAKNLIEEGITKLEDVVDNIHAQLKSDIPQLEKKDVHDIIAGEYNKKQKTKSETAKQAEDLRIQARLINNYEALLNGEEPKTEKAKIKRNQEIHDLRSKIKGLQKENTEANKFYGESDTGNKKIEKLEDELQRLKERRDKEPTEVKKREVSQREKELKQQIADERKKIATEEKEANTRYKENIPDELKSLQALKKRNETELAKVKKELKTGNFAKPVKKPLLADAELKNNFPQAYKETLASQTKLIKAKQERQLRMALQQFENLSQREKFAKNAVRYLNVPRTLMASMDYSAPLRQAIVVTTAHPFTAAKAFKTMFQHGWSQEAFDRYYHELQENPRYKVMQDSKLAITDPHSLHLNAQEEAFLGGNIAEKIPIIGRGVKASERAYVSYLNKMRIDLFSRYADIFEENGKTFDNNPELYKGLASYINSATGRGNLGFADAAAPMLNSFLFSPRLIASRINLLTNWANPKFYKTVPKEVRVLYFKDMAKFIAAGASFLALAKYGFGAQVETDPRSSDFGKIRVGDTRWDIWGGFQPYIRVITQVMTGQRKTDALGVYEIDKKFGQSRLDVLSSFSRGKLAPIPSMAVDLIGGRNIQGQKIERRFDLPFYSKDNPQGTDKTITDEAANHLLPLIFSDVQSAMKDKGIAALFTVGIPSTFGVGVQTYEPRVAKGRTSKSLVPPKPKLPKP